MVRWRDRGFEFRVPGLPPIWVHPAVPLLPSLFTFHLWSSSAPGRGIAAAIVVAATISSFLAHEIAHCVVGVWWGLQPTRIRLFPIGGMAEFVGRLDGPRADRQITLAGPAINLVIGAACLAAAWLATAAPTATPDGRWFNPPPVVLPPPVEVVRLALTWIGWINLGLAGLNLLPGVPLDGGQVALSFLEPRLGTRRAMFWVGLAGVVTGLATGLLSLMSWLAGAPVWLPPSVAENWAAMRGRARRPGPR